MSGQPQGSSSGRTEVTVRLDWTHINRDRLRKLSEQLLELAKLDQKHEMALIHWNLVPDTPEEIECKRLEKEMEALASQIQSNYSKTPSFP